MWLLGLLVRCVLVAPLAVFAQLDPVGIVLLVLHGGVIAALTHSAGEGDDVFHGWLSGWGCKEKSLGYLGAVNTSRGSPATPELQPQPSSMEIKLSLSQA